MDPTEPDQPTPDPASELGEAPPITAETGGHIGGEVVRGTVVSVDAFEVELDLGEGQVGVIPARHYDETAPSDLTYVVSLGDEIEAAVLVREDTKHRIVLSRTWARRQRAWDALEQAANDHADITGRVTRVVKGGLSVDVGVRAFLPASLAEVEGSELDALVGQQITARVIEVDREKARVLLSRRAAVRAEQRQHAKEVLGAITKGEKRTGRIVELTDFGAFVDLGDGIRGLIHISRLSWSRVRHPSEVVTVGDEVEVEVLDVRPAKQQVRLSLRSGQDPLKALTIGERMSGTVSRLVDFGAFVMLESGVEGLVHNSELSEYRVHQPEEVVLPGEEVFVRVIGVDRKRRRVDLSIRQAVV